MITHRYKKTSAFTLIELLAVIGIIGVLAAVIGVSLRPGGGASLGNAQRIAASTFQSARSLAVLKNATTGVIFYGDQGSSTDSSKYLRFMQVIYQNGVSDLDGDPNTPDEPVWVAQGQGTYLPQGVYFIPPTAGEINLHTSSIDIAETSSNGSSNNYSMPLDVFTVATTGAPSFSIDGTLFTFSSNGNSNDPGDRVVLMAGTVGAPGTATSPPELIIDNEFATAGFFLRRLGTVTLADNEDINSDLNVN